MKFSSFLICRRRGVLLAALTDCAPGMAVAADLLTKFCLAISLRATQDDVETDLSWLADRNLVQLGHAGPLLTAVITRSGRDVVARLVVVPGVDIADTAEG